MPKENEQLEAMLADVTREAQEAPGGPPESPPPPTPEAKPEAPKEPPKPATEVEDDEPEQVEDQNGLVPRQAFDRERHRRTQWKEKFARADGELAAIKRQLEEAQRQPPPAPPQQMFVPPPDPGQDPAGFMVHAVQQNQKAMLNERLNMSEAMIRDKVGDEQLDAAINDFREAAQRDPSMWGKLYGSPHPYGWLVKEMDNYRLHRDIGNDPAAYRAKIVAEERAKWEQEASSARSAPVSPAANLPPSLANVRSMASRSEPAFTGPPSDADVLAPVQQRKGGTARW